MLSADVVMYVGKTDQEIANDLRDRILDLNKAIVAAKMNGIGTSLDMRMTWDPTCKTDVQQAVVRTLSRVTNL